MLDKELWRLGLPFFLAVLVTAASIRWILSRSFSRPEAVIAYVVSTATAGITISGYVIGGGWDRPSNLQEWVAVGSPIVILLAGVYLLRRNRRTGRSREFSPVMAMETAYLANSVLCLVAFFPDWQMGAYCALAATVAFAIQIILFSVQPGRSEHMA